MEKEENVSELHNFVIGSTEVFSATQFLRVLANADSYNSGVRVEDVRIEAESAEITDSRENYWQTIRRNN